MISQSPYAVTKKPNKYVCLCLFLNFFSNKKCRKAFFGASKPLRAVLFLFRSDFRQHLLNLRFLYDKKKNVWKQFFTNKKKISSIRRIRQNNLYINESNLIWDIFPVVDHLSQGKTYETELSTLR